ncbi:MAG TPA: glycosyltransferase N-terminal domain-containing protein [Gemmatimonadales bacterium]|nr:glycosyltransferase N-terminal domain-containing protein [Gemmatimonadales bacterium]
MPATSLPYRALAGLGSALAPLAGLADPKFRAGHEGRLGAPVRLGRWAERHRDRSRPLVWFHASSVGEGLQAESVLRELRGLAPDAQFAYTHFSPSALALARRVPVDVADYLPYDRPAAVHDTLEALAPDLLVFAKLDLWPELATRAAARGTAVALVAATVSPGSGRLRWPARPLLHAGYRCVAAAGAISPEDGARLARLGVPDERIRVLGDPRFDSAAARVRSVAPDDPLLRFGRGVPTLVAGSTWPGDEAVLLAAFARLRARHPDARLILAPHEPTAGHLVAVERAAARLGLPAPVRLGAADGPEPLLMVDRVGVLATLYGAGTMAYVGGGYGRAGLHSVLEPAAWGVPVAFGPAWGESRDAGLLLQAGAAEALGRATGTADLLRCWDGWIGDEPRRKELGQRARAVVAGGLGAARRSAEMLARLTGSRLPRTSPTGEPPARG